MLINLKIIAVDTANPIASIALLRDDEVSSKTLDKEKVSSFLLPAIERVLSEAKIWYQDLDLIAVTRGPGSFTGVRVGLTFARTASAITGIRVLAYDLETVLKFHQQKDPDKNSIDAVDLAKLAAYEFAQNCFSSEVENTLPLYLKEPSISIRKK